MPFKAQPRNESPGTWGAVVFPVRDIQNIVPAKGNPVFGMILFWTPAGAGWRVELRVRWKRRVQCRLSDKWRIVTTSFPRKRESRPPMTDRLRSIRKSPWRVGPDRLKTGSHRSENRELHDGFGCRVASCLSPFGRGYLNSAFCSLGRPEND